MAIEGGPQIDNNETEEHKKVDVWMVDDDTDIFLSMRRVWKITSQDYDYTNYPKAEEALNAIKEKIEKNEPIPPILLVDGNLVKDSGRYRFGENFITDIRALDIPQPTLIGHSNSESSNKKMLEAGADFSINKASTDARDYIDAFKKVIEGKK